VRCDAAGGAHAHPVSCLTERVEHLPRRPHAADGRKIPSDRKGVQICLARRHRVFDEHEVVSEVVAGARRRLDADVGRDSADHDRVHAAPAQLQIEIRAVERTRLMLGDADVRLGGIELGHDLGPVARRLEWRTRPVDDRSRKQYAVRSRVHVHEHDEATAFPKSGCELRRARNHVRCGVRLGGCGRDAALQVDEDERGARWIQRERRHSGFRQEAPAPDAGTGAAGSARALPNDRRFACTMPHFTRYADAAAISSTHSSMYTFSPSNQSTGWPLSVGSENSEWAKKNAADTYATQCSSFHVWRVIRCRTYDVTTTSANV